MNQLNNDKINETPADAPQLCPSCCEFFGQKHNDYLCSKCYREKCKAEDKNLIPSPIATQTEISEVPIQVEDTAPTTANTSADEIQKTEIEVEKPKPVQKDTSKCTKCTKKVGVLGYACRCGSTYCKNHRLPEDHDCEFDYRTAGQAKLTKDNPTVVASKLAKI